MEYKENQEKKKIETNLVEITRDWYFKQMWLVCGRDDDECVYHEKQEGDYD